MWSLRKAASTGLVLKPETKQVQGPDEEPLISLWWARRILASSCWLPPRAHPSESYQKSLADWMACGERSSYMRAQAQLARSWERYFLAGPAECAAMSGSFVWPRVYEARPRRCEILLDGGGRGVRL